MKTIAQQLNVKTVPFIIRNDNQMIIYFEDSNGYWYKRGFDEQNNEIYFEDSDKYWYKREFDNNNNEIYHENSNGYWYKREYDNDNEIYFGDSFRYRCKRGFDTNNNEIYYENSDGVIRDNRPTTELTLDEIAKKFNINVNQLKVIK